MKNAIKVLAIASLTIVGCGSNHEHNEDGSHPHSEDVHEHEDGTKHVHDDSEHEQEEFKVVNDSQVLIEETESHSHGEKEHTH